MVQDLAFTGAKEFSTLNYIIMHYSDTDTQVLDIIYERYLEKRAEADDGYMLYCTKAESRK